MISSSLIDKITDLSVLNSQDMTSDHFPIEASISMGYQLENKSAAKSIPYLSKKIYKTSLPPNIVNLIKERRKNKKGSNLIPNLILNENEFKTNEEKGKCFGELLSSIFKIH
ncbi:hypothetical protein BpHYR1_050547 [Brachionus plicatilis]|uniref:RNA-directed DNA polymerase from mobile element jockey-like n=1 Tax=Brachionus plicatilis TaxID=10195 RepID=A0A3M7SBA4_BRAPC|nr:hypothetical protein BpHYR1_050547 [Brachionus plicatilis]